MAWKRIEDRQLEWDLMQAGLLWVLGDSGTYYRYDTDCAMRWQAAHSKRRWFSAENWRKNYIQLED